MAQQTHLRRTIVCATYLEEKLYSYERIRPEGKESGSRKKEGEKRDDSLSRTRQHIYRMVSGNMTGYPNALFCTFTFAENELEGAVAWRRFRAFLRSYGRRHYGNERAVVYIATAERQQRGAVHIHAVLFNISLEVYNRDLEITKKRKREAWLYKKIHGRAWTYEEFSTDKYAHLWTSLDDDWIEGFTDLRPANKTLRGQHVRDMGAYIAKYIGKEFLVPFGKCAFSASKGLERPKTIFSYGRVFNEQEWELEREIKQEMVTTGKTITRYYKRKSYPQADIPKLL